MDETKLNEVEEKNIVNKIVTHYKENVLQYKSKWSTRENPILNFSNSMSWLELTSLFSYFYLYPNFSNKI